MEQPASPAASHPTMRSAEEARAARCDPAEVAAAAFPLREGGTILPLGGGLINRTLLVEEPGEQRWVLQRVNPIFPPGVQLDIEAVTRHLTGAGLTTPLLQRTRDGGLWVDLGADGIWRMLSYVEGFSLDATDDPRLLRAAGGLVARFHRALTTLRHDFRSVRAGVHDTERHLSLLAQALREHHDHRMHGSIAPVAEAILELGERLPRIPDLPLRVVHGDLKISNVRFAPGGEPEALALVDLDTLGRGTLPVELGDAFRSWCNPSGEDAESPRFDLSLFKAAVSGYATASAGMLLRSEQDVLVDALALISLELASRFCRDAFEESYFGWSSRRFGSAAEHNLRRATNQLALCRDILRQQAAGRSLVQEAFRRERG